MYQVDRTTAEQKGETKNDYHHIVRPNVAKEPSEYFATTKKVSRIIFDLYKFDLRNMHDYTRRKQNYHEEYAERTQSVVKAPSQNY